MMAIYMVREVICEPKKDSISRATSQVPRYNHQQQEIHLFLPTICFCKRFNAYNHMAPYAFPSTHKNLSLKQTQMIVSFLDLKIKLDVSCSQDDIPHSFRIQCNQMEDHKKYNHRQQVPSSAYHFSAKDSMLVQSR